MSFKPGDVVARQYVKDGVRYWVKGYRIFDPKQEFASIGGVGPAKVKKRSRHGFVFVVSDGQYKPIRIAESEVRPHNSATAVTFASVFGSSGTSAVRLTGVEMAEAEDLTIGLEPTVPELEEEKEV